MGLLTIFKRLFYGKAKKLEVEKQAKCPYCNSIMDPPPKRKKKVLCCQKLVYVRTHPITNQINYLSEEEVIKFDWIKRFLSWGDNWQEATKKWDSESTLLEKRFRRTPSAKDVSWSLLNKLRIEASINSDLSGYGSWTYEMADQLLKERKFRDAQMLFFEVAILNICEPFQFPFVKSVLAEKPPIDENFIYFLKRINPESRENQIDLMTEQLTKNPDYDRFLIAPMILKNLEKIEQKEEQSKDDFEEAFKKQAMLSIKSWGLPYDADQLWLLFSWDFKRNHQ